MHADTDGDAVPFSELLGLARDEGLSGLDVHVLQAPGDGNGQTAIVQATARSSQGGFSAIGEASPLSSPQAWHPFLTTLAELRAKSRALRELTGLDHGVQEELAVPYGVAGDSDQSEPSPVRSTPPPGRAATFTAPAQARPSLVPPIERLRASADDEDNSDMDAPSDDDEGDRTLSPAPARQIGPARPAPASAPAPEPSGPPDVDSVPADMIDKLKRLAMSIAQMEGADLSDAEVSDRLDAFFVRAFKHPLNRASRIEGQRAVQNLSSTLAKMRSAAQEDRG